MSAAAKVGPRTTTSHRERGVNGLSQYDPLVALLSIQADCEDDGDATDFAASSAASASGVRHEKMARALFDACKVCHREAEVVSRSA